jgi:hypothetical protein
MNAISINALRDAVKSLAQSLQVSTIFPAGLLVLVNAYFVIPVFHPDFECTTPQNITIVISLTLMLSYTLYAFNFPLIRLFEGYKLDFEDHELDCFPLLKRLTQIVKSDLTNRQVTRRNLADAPSKLQKYYELDRDFPSEDRLLPTKIGNVIAAFEEYPQTRYGMDSIALWPRLVPVLEDEGFLDYVVQEKAVFDFLLNTCVVTAILGIELTFITAFWRFFVALLILVVTCIACIILYQGMYVAARQWGTVVRVAFDRHRYDLAQSLHLKPAHTFSEEWDRWEKISQFFLYRKTSYRTFDAFIPQYKVLQRKEAGKGNNDKVKGN